MPVLVVGKVLALVLSASTFVFLFLHDSWRSDNLFLVPDLVLCAGLAIAALTPWAERTLPLAFGLAAGVLMTSVASYAVDGRLGTWSLLGAVVAAGTGTALAFTSGYRPDAGTRVGRAWRWSREYRRGDLSDGGRSGAGVRRP